MVSQVLGAEVAEEQDATQVRDDALGNIRLRQDTIAETLDISLTPVREAFSQLAAEGILKHVPHKGVVVAKIPTTAESIREIYLIRSVLEALAVELSAANLREDDLARLESLQRQMSDLVKGQSTDLLKELNYEFHMYLYESCGSPQLKGMIGELWNQFPWSDLLQIPGLAQESMHQHAKLLEAMRDGNGELGAQIMKRHIEMAGEVLIAHVTRTTMATEG